MMPAFDLVRWAEATIEEHALLRRWQFLDRTLKAAMLEDPVDPGYLLDLARELGETGAVLDRAGRTTRHLTKQERSDT